MSMHPLAVSPVPPDTARIARLAFPKGNRYLLLRDHLGTIYQDRHFAHLFAADGQPAIAPCARCRTFATGADSYRRFAKGESHRVGLARYSLRVGHRR